MDPSVAKITYDAYLLTYSKYWRQFTFQMIHKPRASCEQCLQFKQSLLISCIRKIHSSPAAEKQISWPKKKEKKQDWVALRSNPIVLFVVAVMTSFLTSMFLNHVKTYFQTLCTNVCYNCLHVYSLFGFQYRYVIMNMSHLWPLCYDQSLLGWQTCVIAEVVRQVYRVEVVKVV